MAERTPQGIEELFETYPIDRVLLIESRFDLVALCLVQVIKREILKLDDSSVVIVELLDAAPFEIEDRILRNMLPAIRNEVAFVRIFAVEADINIRFTAS